MKVLIFQCVPAERGMRLILYIIPLSTFRLKIWTLKKLVSTFRIPWIGMSFLV